MAKKAPAKPAKPTKPPKKRMTKSAIYAELAEKTDLPRKKIGDLFDCLFDLIKREVAKNGPGEFVLPTSLVKVQRKEVPARPERMIRNPRTGEMQLSPAKPKSEKIKVYALKTLKSLA